MDLRSENKPNGLKAMFNSLKILSLLLLPNVEMFNYRQACCRTEVLYEIQIQLKGCKVEEVGIPYSDWKNETKQLTSFRPFNKNGQYTTSYLGSCAETDSIIKYEFKKAGYCLIKVKTESDKGKKITKDYKISVDSLTIKSYANRTIQVKVTILK